jgi:hypothetical protein
MFSLCFMLYALGFLFALRVFTKYRERALAHEKIRREGGFTNRSVGREK